MQIKQVLLKNFRCFEHLSLPINNQYVLIEGLNGKGKTSLLEALHYACYLRSFRTYSPQELTRMGQDAFFIKIDVAPEHEMLGSHEIQVGFFGKRRTVKINQKQIVSYKELLEYYRIITLTEDDLSLIKEGPEVRRAFIDQYVLIDNPDYVHVLKKLQYTVDNRTILLKKGISQESYDFWTEQLWSVSKQIQHMRAAALHELEQQVSLLIKEYFQDELHIECRYQYKKGLDKQTTFDQLMSSYPSLMADEMHQKRSLFGAHLDDFLMLFQQQKSRIFASRGQQKLIVMLMKIAQIQLLMAKSKLKPIFLLDDFMTDFDPDRGKTIINLLKILDCQLIFTAPARTSWFYECLNGLSIQYINISV